MKNKITKIELLGKTENGGSPVWSSSTSAYCWKFEDQLEMLRLKINEMIDKINQSK